VTEPPIDVSNTPSEVSDGPASTRDGAPPPTTHAEVVTEQQAHVPGAKTSRSRRLLEWVVVLLVAVIVAFGLRTFVVQTFFVPSGSMIPTLQIGDRIIVWKLGYTIHRGDIVVFRRTPADTYTTDADLVKRVIGLPGETISSRGDTVLIDGKAIKEPWLPPLTTHMTSQGLIDCKQSAFDIPTTKIAPKHYFVMGDCRGDSADSREWGTVPASYVIGKVVVIVWRFGRPSFHWF